jgi:hypothetical protein
MKTKLPGIIALSVSLRLFAAAPADGEFIAHEWGTFTSVQGANGIQMQWNPFVATDLPRFVYNRALPTGRGENGGKVFPDTKSALMSYVRMETPVIYFYSTKGFTADVQVEMPHGRITEWYPRATRVGPSFTTNKAEAKEASRSLIEWKGLTVLPRDTKEITSRKLIREKAGSHYYEAREVDANFVRMPSPYESGGFEYERDLFYRGVGFFRAPLTVQLADGEQYLQLSTTNTEPMTDLFVLTIRNGMAGYQRIDRVDNKITRSVKLDNTPLAPLSDVRARLMREMASALEGQGLYAKEAKAMVNTWKDQWFEEEGTRVLYLLPRSWTDQALPLTVSPKPSHVVRVMVGRAEMITPAMERELKKHVTAYSSGDGAAKARAVADVKKLGIGRFLEPATRIMLGQNPNKEFSQAAWKVASEASKAIAAKEDSVVGKTAGVSVKETSGAL